MSRSESESAKQQIQRLTKESVGVVPYDKNWPDVYRREQRHLLDCLPDHLVYRIEHFGSTAVSGLAAKPIIDILVGVRSLDETKRLIVPILTKQGYEYIWRPTSGDDAPPWYAWFIKRDLESGRRTHHLHMVEPGFQQHWDRLLFRDYLTTHRDAADQYGSLKRSLARQFPDDRVQYTLEKTRFINTITELARREQSALGPGEDSELS